MATLIMGSFQKNKTRINASVVGGNKDIVNSKSISYFMKLFLNI